MEKIINFFESKASIRNVIIGLMLIVMFNTFFLPFLPSMLWDFHLPLDKILDLKFSYDANSIYSLFDELGTKGRNSYKMTALFIDFPYALIYSFTYGLIVYMLLKANELLKYKYLLFIPLLIGIFDVFENLGIAMMLHSYPVKLATLSSLTPNFTSLKWIFSAITFILIMGNILIYSFRKMKN